MTSGCNRKQAGGLQSGLLPGIDLEDVWTLLRSRVTPAAFLRFVPLDRAIGSNIRVTLVSEIGQQTGSFKFRAALSAALHTDAPRLLAASSGNFGAALARAARMTGKGCTIVMPDRAPRIKIEAVQREGAAVDLVDTDTVTRAQRVSQLATLDPEAQVLSAFDDPWVVAGNSSLGAELFASSREELPEILVAPVGGGGLASGLVLARDFLEVSCSIVGAEPALANDAARSLAQGRIVANDREPDTLCDGARTLSLGRLNFEILRLGLEAIVEVDDPTVVRAQTLLLDTAGLEAEPTGALALAALLQEPARFAGRRVAVVVSGGNFDR